MVALIDGELNESPRYTKTVNCAISFFSNAGTLYVNR